MPNHRGERTRHNGFAIRDFRLKMGYTPARLGELVGLSDKAIINIETETRDTTREKLYKIAYALDVNIKSIVHDPAYANGNGSAA